MMHDYKPFDANAELGYDPSTIDDELKPVKPIKTENAYEYATGPVFFTLRHLKARRRELHEAMQLTKNCEKYRRELARVDAELYAERRRLGIIY